MNSRNNIILIRPHFGDFSNYFIQQINPPIGLGYLASYLEIHGLKVDILDLNLRRLSREDILRFIEKRNPLFIGISALTSYYNELRSLSKLIRKEIAGAFIVLGGVHVSAIPEISLKECQADVVVIGEGEKTSLELAKALKKQHLDFSSIDGLCYFENGEIKFSKPRELIKELDSLPMPAWHKINPNKYPKNPHGFIMKRKRAAPILSTRGCPFSCHYCASCRFWGQRIRFRSPKNVVDEIEYLHDTFGIREIHFWDDNLTLKRSHIIGICREILKRGLDVTMTAPNGVRVDTLDERILKIMKMAGFYYLIYAVESGSPKILRSAGKIIDLKKIVKNAMIAKKLGFTLNSFFILGFPKDTIDTMNKTIKFARAVPFDYVSFFLMSPLPGSKIYDDWKENRKLEEYDWNDLYYYELTETLCNFSPRNLLKMQEKAHRLFLFSLKNLINVFWLRIKFFQFSQFKFYMDRLTTAIFGLTKNISKNQ